jgi:hypothetical protein
VIPIADPRGGAPLEVRLRRSEARAERERRERARAGLLAFLVSLALDPVLIEQSGRDAVQRTFLEWAEERRRIRWLRR